LIITPLLIKSLEYYDIILVYSRCYIKGQTVGMLNNEVYHYVKNLQGDVIRILDENGNTVVEYSYDPWGVPTVTGDTELAKINPCSYRGYDYDEETGYYYLQTRYYVPTIGRFINMDDSSVMQVGNMPLSCNLYAYCDNNAINEIDSNGCFSIKVYVVAATTAAVIAAISKVISNYGKGLRGWNLFRGVLGTSIGNSVNVVLLMKFIREGNLGMLVAAVAAAAVQTVIDVLSNGDRFCYKFAHRHCTKWTSGKGVKINGK